MIGVREGPVAAAVRAGLDRPDKRLPPWLLYDAEGSRLFERITELDTYYLTRAERGILERHADDIARVAPAEEVVELGAGTATKSELVLAALDHAGVETRFVPVDVSAEPMRIARERLARSLPQVRVAPLIATNEVALAGMAPSPSRLVLFLGSSIGNLEDDEAIALLRAVRRVAGALLLGADLRKAVPTLLAAYDDPVTDAFIRNVLTRLNRELGADFAQGAMRYVPVWNAGASRMQMYLESTREQRVHVAALGLTVRLGAGERIHVEDSRKYDPPAVDALLAAAGFARAATWTAPDEAFLLTLAR